MRHSAILVFANKQDLVSQHHHLQSCLSITLKVQLCQPCRHICLRPFLKQG